MPASSLYAERRQARRHPFGGQVRLCRHDEPILLATAENISSTGLMVTRHGGQPAFGLGERLRCQMADGPHPPINAHCRVVWARAAEANKIAIGLAFEEVTNSSSVRLGRLIRRTEAATNNEGIRFDPFCETGTWSPEHLLTDADCFYEAVDDTIVDKPPMAEQHRPSFAATAFVLASAVVLGAMIILLLVLL